MKCYRTACNIEAHPLLKHSQNGQLYCIKCARKINDYNPGLIPWPDISSLMDGAAIRRANGYQLWQNNSHPSVKAQRAYYWVDRLIVTDGNKVIGDTRYSTFDFRNWTKIEG